MIRTTIDGERGSWHCEHVTDDGLPCDGFATGGTMQDATTAARAHAAGTGHPVTVEETLIVRYEVPR